MVISVLASKFNFYFADENVLVKEDNKSTPEVVAETDTVNDPYAYIKDKGFTTEIFKIEIQNLPKKFGIQVKKIYQCH